MSLAQANPSPMQDHYNSAYSGMLYNNDTDFDNMFAQAERAAKRTEPDINISMTHAGDERTQVMRKKQKIRIGEKYSDEDEDLLNDDHSRKL
jgi:hypothetical protein